MLFASPLEFFITARRHGSIAPSMESGYGNEADPVSYTHLDVYKRQFQTHSATIDSVEVKRRGAVRASKLYYLRGLEGKKARIKEDLAGNAKARAKAAAAAAAAE